MFSEAIVYGLEMMNKALKIIILLILKTERQLYVYTFVKIGCC